MAQCCRFPLQDHEDTPITDASNLAEICTQSCGAEASVVFCSCWCRVLVKYSLESVIMCCVAVVKRGK